MYDEIVVEDIEYDPEDSSVYRVRRRRKIRVPTRTMFEWQDRAVVGRRVPVPGLEAQLEERAERSWRRHARPWERYKANASRPLVSADDKRVSKGEGKSKLGPRPVAETRAAEGIDDYFNKKPRSRSESHNAAVLKRLLPPRALKRSRLLVRHARRPVDPKPVIVAGKRGRPVLAVGDIRVGCERSGWFLTASGTDGFRGIKGTAHHRDPHFDRALSLRAPWCEGLTIQDALLSCDARRKRGAQLVVLPMHRSSSQTPEMRARAKRVAPDALWAFECGQGGGVCSLAVPVRSAVACRLEGYGVDLTAIASSRFLRTGAALGVRVLRDAGIRVRLSSAPSDHPHEFGLHKVEERRGPQVERLSARCAAWAQGLDSPMRDFDLVRVPDLPVTAEDIRELPGIGEALATGAGLDWITPADVAAQGSAPAQISLLKKHPAWRSTAGRRGYWLVEPAYRERQGLPTVIRPVLIAGFEDRCMELICARFPTAQFRKRVVIEPTSQRRSYGEANLRRLEPFRGEVLVAVDHAEIHRGSVLDLDLFFRQGGGHLVTVLASTHAVPDFAISVLGRL